MVSSDEPRPRVEERPPLPVRTWQLFVLVALGNLVALVVMNEVVLSESVVRSLAPEAATSVQVNQYLVMVRRGKMLGYLLSPAALLAKAACVALLVQLVLLAFLSDPPFARIFRGALWAQAALLLGTLIHSAWLATLPTGAIVSGAGEVTPGSILQLLRLPVPPGRPLALLLQQVTVFDLGWVCLFILALEDGKHVGAVAAAISVGTVWVGLILSRWALSLYVAGLT